MESDFLVSLLRWISPRVEHLDLKEWTQMGFNLLFIGNKKVSFRLSEQKYFALYIDELAIYSF